MIQTDVPIIPVPDKIPSASTWFSELKGLGFDEAITKIANGLVSFGFKLLIAILVFYVGRFIIRKIFKFVNNIMTTRHVDPSLTTFTLSLIRMLMYFILVITIIGILGIETSSFLALFASAGVALGMALSGTLQNFAGGVIILLLKPYKVGDFVEAQGYTGTVKSIQLFFTIINTVDNKSILIPNGAMSNATVNNYSIESFRRVDWTVSLSYETDYAKAKTTILEMLMEDDRVVKGSVQTGNADKAPFVGLKEMGDSSISITVRAWAKSGDYWPLFFEMNERFFTELPQKGFSFPFPQLDIHFDKPNV